MIPLITVYRYRRQDVQGRVFVTGTRMGTAVAIAMAGYDLITEDSMDVAPGDVDADGWTAEGYWGDRMSLLRR